MHANLENQCSTNRKRSKTCSSRSQQKKSANKTVDHDSDSDGELIEDESDNEEVEDEDESGIGASLHTEESDVVASAAHDTARYSALCEDYDNVVQEAAETSVTLITADTTSTEPLSDTVAHEPIKSALLDGAGNISIKLMLDECLHLQSGLTTRSERVVRIDPKFKLSGVINDDKVLKIRRQEASHRLRVAQDLNTTLQRQKPKKDREHRWKSIVSDIKHLIKPEGMLKHCSRHVL